jgi:nicotinate-nucleotide--dimethylbenzimidazole phosphoribosyltransferase
MISQESIQKKIDFKTKPIGSLGELEVLAARICEIQNTLNPKLTNPYILVFAGDHGIVSSGVSAYPQEVTYQMVMNFLQGGAAINVFCKQNNIKLMVIDTGVNHDFDNCKNLIHKKVAYGTKSFLEEPAMTSLELEKCFSVGNESIIKILHSDSNIVGFGEMGIGNTSSASLLMHKLLHLNLEDCTGKGTGLTDKQLQTKISILKQASKTSTDDDPKEVLRCYGGFEIAAIVGAMISAAKNKMIVMVDGFIVTAAYLVAKKLYPNLQKFAVFCHQSEEQGHRLLLEKLNVVPLLKLNMRLGEGTGCALAYPIIKGAITFINEMASFESASVSQKN